jgi:hypothetical protein
MDRLKRRILDAGAQPVRVGEALNRREEENATSSNGGSIESEATC